MTSVPAIWTLNLRDPEKKSVFEASLRSSTALERLREILSQKLDALEATELASEFYEKENLDPRLYVNLGRKKELRELLQTLTF